MKTLPNIIELQLLAVDFKDTIFISSDNCAVSKACKRQLNITKVGEVVDFCTINDNTYNHSYYGCIDFLKDKEVAQTAELNTVIRTIKLTKDV